MYLVYRMWELSKLNMNGAISSVTETTPRYNIDYININLKYINK